MRLVSVLPRRVVLGAVSLAAVFVAACSNPVAPRDAAARKAPSIAPKLEQAATDSTPRQITQPWF